jgi:hypothetical protein
MFEKLFSFQSAVQMHRAAPLAQEREDFLCHLHQRGVCRSSLRNSAALLNQIVRFLRQEKLRDVKESEIEIAAQKTFEGVRRRAEVSRTDGIGREPRLRDLRRTFAVHCLRAWTEEKKNLRSKLPILAAYLGHADLNSTEDYLSLVPSRFQKQLSSLSPVRRDGSPVVKKPPVKTKKVAEAEGGAGQDPDP